MRDRKVDIADASFQIRVSRKTLATVARWHYENGYVISNKSELGRVTFESLETIAVMGYGAKEFTDSKEATAFLLKLGLTPLSVRGHEATYQKQLEREAVEEGRLPPPGSLRQSEKVSKSDLPQVEQERIDQLVNEFEKEE